MKKSVIILAILLVAFSGKSQDIHFSQFDKMPLLLNPGLAGMGKGYNRASLIYRTQYTTVGNVYSSPGLNIDFPILSEKMRMGNTYFATGLHFAKDVAGNAKTSQLNVGLTLAIILKLSRESKMSFGVQGSYLQRVIGLDDVKWGSQYNGAQYDASIASGETLVKDKIGLLNGSVGMAYKYYSSDLTLYGIERRAFDIGAAMHNVTRGPLHHLGGNQNKLSTRITAHAKALFTFRNRPFGLVPQALFQRQQGLNEIVFGGGLNYYAKADTKYTGFVRQAYFGFDLLYRWKDAIVTNFRVKFNDFEVGFSYDITASQLGPNVNRVGGFEISLKFIDTYGILFNQGNKHVVNSSNGNLNL